MFHPKKLINFWMGKCPWNTYIHLVEMIMIPMLLLKDIQTTFGNSDGVQAQDQAIRFLGFRLTFWEGPRILKFLLSKKSALDWSFRAWPITIWKNKVIVNLEIEHLKEELLIPTKILPSIIWVRSSAQRIIYATVMNSIIMNQ